MEFESIIVAVITGIVTLIGVITSNSKSRAVSDMKIDQLRVEVNKHNQVIERVYQLEQDVAVINTEIGALKEEIR